MTSQVSNFNSSQVAVREPVHKHDWKAIAEKAGIALEIILLVGALTTLTVFFPYEVLTAVIIGGGISLALLVAIGLLFEHGGH